MKKTLKKIISLLPVVNKLVPWLNRKLTVELPWQKERKCIIQAVSAEFGNDMSLDVSRRYGYYLFHNTNNSLINRGENFEPEVQPILMLLISLDKLRNRETIFADIGVNIGLHTFYLKSKYPDLNIVAFDPSPASWRYFELSVKYNKINNTRLEKIALSDKNGVLEFYNWGEESSADSLLDTDRVHGVKPNILSVEAKKLDDIENIGPITVIKMDCEGAEFSILKGAKNTIIKNRPLILIEFYEIHNKIFNVKNRDIYNFMEEMDYSLYSIELQLLDIAAFELSQSRGDDNYILLPNDLIQKRN